MLLMCAFAVPESERIRAAEPPNPVIDTNVIDPLDDHRRCLVEQRSGEPHRLAANRATTSREAPTHEVCQVAVDAAVR